MFTATAARSAFEEADKGTIEPGKLADLLILDRDPFQVAADQIAAIRAEMVFVGGRRYHFGSR
jgi:predicted amidohydrolase YtcJ